MPILIKPGTLVCNDVYGNAVTDIPTGNAGSIVRLSFDIEEDISIASSDLKPVFFDKNSLTFQFFDYESLNGFALNGNIFIEVTLSGGTTDTQTTTITAINYNLFTVKVASIATLSPSFIKTYYSGSDRVLIRQTDLRAELILNVNFTDINLSNLYDYNASKTQGQFTAATGAYRASTIDGSFTRFGGDATGVGVGGSITLTQIGKKSGMFDFFNVLMSRNADFNNTRQYSIVIETINPTCFHNDERPLNFYFDVEWYSKQGVTLNPTVYQWNFNPSYSGWFGQAFLNQQPDSEVIQGISEGSIYYDSTTNHVVQIQSTSSELALGSVYTSNDQTYFYQNYFSQAVHGILNLAWEIGGVIIPNTYTSIQNNNGAGYDIIINSVVYALGVYTVDFDFVPNPDFEIFMAGRADDDRYFKIWSQSGNVNQLLFSGQLEKTPNATVSLDTVQAIPEWANWIADDPTLIQDGTNAGQGGFFSSQDNALLKAELLLLKNRRYNQITFEVVAAEIVDNSNYFVLENRTISLTDQPYIDSSGITQINVSQPKNDGLPTTSGMNDIRVTRLGANPDQVNQFGVDLYYPVQFNWRQWLTEPNAPNLFYPNQKKNWLNYFSNGYGIYLRTFLEAETVNYEYFFKIGDLYDFNEVRAGLDQWQGSAAIEYYIESTGQQVTGLIKGEIMRVKVVVTAGPAIVYAPGFYWGQMAIEPYQSSPLFMLSTNYDHDNNPSSPIYPVTGETRLYSTVDTPSQITYESLIDCTKLQSGSQTIYLKHFINNVIVVEQVRLSFQTTVLPYPQFGFTIDEDKCCDIMKVFADLTSDDTDKNNITTAWWPLIGGDTIQFELYKSNCQLAAYQPTNITFPEQSTAVYASIPWVQVLSGDGAGVYTLVAKYTPPFGADPIETIWGKYNLTHYSDSAAFGLVRLRSTFNNNQFIEGINFRNSAVIDCLNVPGFFGKRDPKTEVINTTLNTRIVAPTKRENVNEYELKTDPVQLWFTKRLIDLFGLSETDTYVSCINKQHEQYRNQRVAHLRTEKPDYHTGGSLASCVLIYGDKETNQRTIY